MPWCDIVSLSERVSIWYYTNSLSGNVGSLDRSKETILLIHPYFMDSSWMRLQFHDPNLKSRYNLIAYDTRNHGLTQNTPTGKLDIWVNAADIAFLHHKLGLPPVHVFACQPTATYSALHFAALFPEKVLSLCLSQVPPPRQLDWVHKAGDDFLHRWCTASNHAEMELVVAGVLEAFSGAKESEEDLRSEIFNHMVTQYPPCRRSRFAELSNTIMNRDAIEPRVAALITAPTLIIQGHHNLANPVKYAYELRDLLVNAQGGAQVFEVEGGSGMMNLLPDFSKTVNQTLYRFLQRLPPIDVVDNTWGQTLGHTSDWTPASAARESLLQRMRQALHDLARIQGNPQMAQRDPHSPLSFSCVPAELECQQMQLIYRYAMDQENAFNPVGPTGHLKHRWLEHTIPSQIETYLNGVPANEPNLFPPRVSRYGIAMPKRKIRDRERTNSVMKFMDQASWTKRETDYEGCEGFENHQWVASNGTVQTGPHPTRPYRPLTPGSSALVLFTPLNPQTMLPISKDELQLARARRTGACDPTVGAHY